MISEESFSEINTTHKNDSFVTKNFEEFFGSTPQPDDPDRQEKHDLQLCDEVVRKLNYVAKFAVIQTLESSSDTEKYEETKHETSPIVPKIFRPSDPITSSRANQRTTQPN